MYAPLGQHRSEHTFSFAALGRTVRRQFLHRGLRGLAGLTWHPFTPRAHLALPAHMRSPDKKAGLLHPDGKLTFVKLDFLTDVEVASKFFSKIIPRLSRLGAGFCWGVLEV